MNQVEALVDLLQRQHMGDHRIDLDLAVHVPVDDPGNVGAALSAAKGCPLPDAAGDELERAGADFLPRFGHADDGSFPPAARTTFESGAHHPRLAGGVELEVEHSNG